MPIRLPPKASIASMWLRTPRYVYVEGGYRCRHAARAIVVPDRKLRFYRDVYSPAPGNPGGFNSLLDNRRRVTGMNEIRSHSRRLTGALILGRAEPSPCGCG